jgi:Putative metallopeptidase
MRRRQNVAFGVSILLVMLGGASCFGDDDSTPAQAKGKGRVTMVYQEDTIRPEHRDAMKNIMDSGVFERMADRLTKAVTLPHDLQVIITDNVPKGIDVPTTDLDGRRSFWPAAFSKQTHDVLAKFLPEIVHDKGAPKMIPQEYFTADALNVWGNQFILGHELGHALIHQLNLPLTGLEEDSADAFAIFFTVNDKDTGQNAALGAAVLFDALGSKAPNLTIEDFSSDHAVILQRVYNFLCSAFGSNPHGLHSLVGDGYIPEPRAMLCGKEWAQLNYGWWTVLEPYLTLSYKKETESLRQQARQNLEKDIDALSAKLRQMRGQQ